MATKWCFYETASKVIYTVLEIPDDVVITDVNADIEAEITEPLSYLQIEDDFTITEPDPALHIVNGTEDDVIDRTDLGTSEDGATYNDTSNPRPTSSVVQFVCHKGADTNYVTTQQEKTVDGTTHDADDTQVFPSAEDTFFRIENWKRELNNATTGLQAPDGGDLLIQRFYYETRDVETIMLQAFMSIGDSQTDLGATPATASIAIGCYMKVRSTLGSDTYLETISRPIVKFKDDEFTKSTYTEVGVVALPAYTQVYIEIYTTPRAVGGANTATMGVSSEFLQIVKTTVG